MQVSSESPSPKRSRAKAKPKDAATVTAKPRKSKATAEPVAAVQVPPTDMAARVATAAYYLAAARNFAPGHELDDWLEAERRLHLRML